MVTLACPYLGLGADCVWRSPGSPFSYDLSALRSGPPLTLFDTHVPPWTYVVGFDGPVNGSAASPLCGDGGAGGWQAGPLRCFRLGADARGGVVEPLAAGSASALGFRVMFRDGDGGCPGGKRRSLEVEFLCGRDARAPACGSRVAEPFACAYVATLVGLAGCPVECPRGGVKEGICSSHGACGLVGGKATCECDEGWGGAACAEAKAAPAAAEEAPPGALPPQQPPPPPSPLKAAAFPWSPLLLLAAVGAVGLEARAQRLQPGAKRGCMGSGNAAAKADSAAAPAAPKLRALRMGKLLFVIVAAVAALLYFWSSLTSLSPSLRARAASVAPGASGALQAAAAAAPPPPSQPERACPSPGDRAPVCACINWLRCRLPPPPPATAGRALVTLFDDSYAAIVRKRWLPRAAALGYPGAYAWTELDGFAALIGGGGAGGELLTCVTDVEVKFESEVAGDLVGHYDLFKFTAMLHSLRCEQCAAGVGGAFAVAFSEADVVLLKDPFSVRVPQVGGGGALVPAHEYRGDLVISKHHDVPMVNIGVMLLFAREGAAAALAALFPAHQAARKRNGWAVGQVTWDAMLGNVGGTVAMHEREVAAGVPENQRLAPALPGYVHHVPPLSGTLGRPYEWAPIHSEQALDLSFASSHCNPRRPTGCWGGYNVTGPRAVAVHFTCLRAEEKRANIEALYTSGTCQRCGDGCKGEGE